MTVSASRMYASAWPTPSSHATGSSARMPACLRRWRGGRGRGACSRCRSTRGRCGVIRSRSRRCTRGRRRGRGRGRGLRGVCGRGAALRLLRRSLCAGSRARSTNALLDRELGLVLCVGDAAEAVREQHPAQLRRRPRPQHRLRVALPVVLPSSPARVAMSIVHVTAISSPVSARRPVTVTWPSPNEPVIEWPRRRTSFTISSADIVALPSMMWIDLSDSMSASRARGRSRRRRGSRACCRGALSGRSRSRRCTSAARRHDRTAATTDVHERGDHSATRAVAFTGRACIQADQPRTGAVRTRCRRKTSWCECHLDLGR
jgi:hypothetical protein